MINKVILIGNVGSDPESRTVSVDVAVSKFSLATNESYKDKQGEKKQITEWHNIECWRGLAEVANKYLKKGAQVYIEGKLKYESWEKDGRRIWSTKIIAHSLKILGKRQAEGSNQAPLPEAPPPEADNQTDDLPF